MGLNHIALTEKGRGGHVGLNHIALTEEGRRGGGGTEPYRIH